MARTFPALLAAQYGVTTSTVDSHESDLSFQIKYEKLFFCHISKWLYLFTYLFFGKLYFDFLIEFQLTASNYWVFSMLMILSVPLK